MQGFIWLFISIMTSAVGDAEPYVYHMADDAVFFVDAVDVLPLQVAGEIPVSRCL